MTLQWLNPHQRSLGNDEVDHEQQQAEGVFIFKARKKGEKKPLKGNGSGQLSSAPNNIFQDKISVTKRDYPDHFIIIGF